MRRECLIFTAPDGGPTRKSNFVRRVYHPLLKAAGIPATTFHSLRHSCATLLIERGANPKAVQAVLGHKTCRVTMEIYAHVTLAALASAANTMDAILRGSANNEGTSEGTRPISKSLTEKEKTRNPIRIAGLPELGRSRDRTCDPSRVKRVLYR